MVTNNRHIVVFDSGIGGMTILSHINKLVHGCEITYIADDKAFPYSSHTEEFLRVHIFDTLCSIVEKYNPDVLVIACNTASTMSKRQIQEVYPDLPIVSTVPGVKVVCEKSRSKLVTVVATPLTVAQRRIFELIEEFGEGVEISSIGSPHLAEIAEKYVQTGVVNHELLSHEIEPLFVEKSNKRTDCIALGCTHYAFLLPEIKKLAPWSVEWIDTARAIAQQTKAQLVDVDNSAQNNMLSFAYTSLQDAQSLSEAWKRVQIMYPV